MGALRVHDLFGKRALVTRESARRLATAVVGKAREKEAVVDFTGIEALTPSFVDELVGTVLREWSGQRQAGGRLVFTNVPTRLSSKFAAIGRGRGVRIEEESDGVWVITQA